MLRFDAKVGQMVLISEGTISDMGNELCEYRERRGPYRVTSVDFTGPSPCTCRAEGDVRHTAHSKCQWGVDRRHQLTMVGDDGDPSSFPDSYFE